MKTKSTNDLDMLSMITGLFAGIFIGCVTTPVVQPDWWLWLGLSVGTLLLKACLVAFNENN